MTTLGASHTRRAHRSRPAHRPRQRRPTPIKAGHGADHDHEGTGGGLRPAGETRFHHRRHRISARNDLFPDPLRRADGEPRRSRRGRRGRRGDRSRALLQADGEREGAEGLPRGAAGHRDRAGIARSSSRIRCSTRRSPPWCWAMAIPSPTTSSCSASPATRSTSRIASPTGSAGRSPPRSSNTPSPT